MKKTDKIETGDWLFWLEEVCGTLCLRGHETDRTLARDGDGWFLLLLTGDGVYRCPALPEDLPFKLDGSRLALDD